MRVATGLVCAFFLLLACKGANFSDKSNSTRKDGDIQTTTTTTPDDQDETIALEPTSVGGAFLGCFVDAQISPELVNGLGADELPVGCQVFEDPHFNRVKENSSVLLESGEVDIAGSPKALVIHPSSQHPRWAWLTKAPLPALHAHMFFQVRAEVGANPIRLKVELLDILPSGLLTGSQSLLTGFYKLRLKGTLFCADGNPIWGWDSVNSKPVVDPVLVTACDKALNFRFTRFENGLRIHVPNPKPLTCDRENYSVEHCNDSCVDLEDYGRGSRVVLWACTKSVQAQSYSLIPATQGAVRIQGNNRPLTRSGDLLIPDLGTTTEFEVVPIAP